MINNIVTPEIKKLHLGFNRRQTTIIRSAITYRAFANLLRKNRPKELFNPMWSRKKVFFIITEYLPDTDLMGYFIPWADKTPKKLSYQNLYDQLRYQGLDQCYFIY